MLTIIGDGHCITHHAFRQEEICYGFFQKVTFPEEFTAYAPMAKPTISVFGGNLLQAAKLNEAVYADNEAGYTLAVVLEYPCIGIVHQRTVQGAIDLEEQDQRGSLHHYRRR